MKLRLVLIISLFVVLTDGAKPKKCFDGIDGYCRKRCKPGEISEIDCAFKKLCCVDEKKKHKESHLLLKPTNRIMSQLDYGFMDPSTSLPNNTSDKPLVHELQ